jgi:hypothetical protein
MLPPLISIRVVAGLAYGLVKPTGEAKDSADYAWTVRVNGSVGQEQRAYSGKHAFSIGKQASFTEEEPFPSAVEYLLGALGGDLVGGFETQAKKRGVDIDAVESVVTGRLGNPMVFLGVIGAEGNPGLESVVATLYVSSEADEAALQEIWLATLATSPLVNTLKRSASLSLTLQQS